MEYVRGNTPFSNKKKTDDPEVLSASLTQNTSKLNNIWIDVVQDYKADPTGTTDSTTAIQNAINAVPVGGTVFFPSGTYIISSTLNLLAGVTYRGTGWNSVIQAKTNCGITTHMLAVKSSSTTFNYNFFIRDLLIDGNKANNTSGTYNGLYVGSVYNGKAENVRVINVPGTSNAGFYLDGTSGYNTSQFHMIECWVYGSQGDGVFSSSYTQDCHILGGDYGGNGNYGFNWNGSSSSIRDAIIWGNKWGVYVDGQSNQITNNNIEGNAAYGVYVSQYGNFALIEGNKVYDNSTGPAGSYDGIYVNGASGSNAIGVSILNNKIFAGIVSNTGYYRYAVNLGTYHANCVVNGNDTGWSTANAPTYNGNMAINGIATGDVLDGTYICTTATRPTGVPISFKAFDTTLNKPIWYKGSGWVDATGGTA